MNPNALAIERGDRIELNNKAPRWTRGLVFVVDEVKLWGVVCFAEVTREEASKLGVFCRIRDGRLWAGMRAGWEVIEAPEKRGAAHG